MKKLKQVKILLKNNGLWEQYKNKFKHKQMKLLFSKIALIFNNNLTSQELYEMEKKILKTKYGKNMFVETYAKLNILNKDKYDWQSFGKFIFYVYQTSTYWKDVKLNIVNIFNKHNFVNINKEKRQLYFKWMHSLSFEETKYNEKIREILKKVF